jgi:hypothetical protein
MCKSFQAAHCKHRAAVMPPSVTAHKRPQDRYEIQKLVRRVAQKVVYIAKEPDRTTFVHFA